MLCAQQEAQTQHGQERKFSCHPPLVCISRRGSWRRRSISTSLALIPTRSRSLRCSAPRSRRSEEHTSELQSPYDIVCRLLLEKKKRTAVLIMRSNAAVVDLQQPA